MMHIYLDLKGFRHFKILAMYFQFLTLEKQACPLHNAQILLLYPLPNINLLSVSFLRFEINEQAVEDCTKVFMMVPKLFSG